MSVVVAPRVLGSPEPLLFRRLRDGDEVVAASSLGGRTVGASEGALHAALLAPRRRGVRFVGNVCRC